MPGWIRFLKIGCPNLDRLALLHHRCPLYRTAHPTPPTFAPTRVAYRNTSLKSKHCLLRRKGLIMTTTFPYRSVLNAAPPNSVGRYQTVLADAGCRERYQVQVRIQRNIIQYSINLQAYRRGKAHTKLLNGRGDSYMVMLHTASSEIFSVRRALRTFSVLHPLRSPLQSNHLPGIWQIRVSRCHQVLRLIT
jgi:hypothetical protein